MPRTRTTFKVVHEFEISADIGELPEHAIAALLEKELETYEPNVFLHGTEWSIGAGGDRGTSVTTSVSVEPVE